MSVAAPTRSFIHNPFGASSLELQGGLADADLVAGLHLHRAGHALAVEVGAVRRAEVLHVPRSVLRVQAVVDVRHVRVLLLDVTSLGPADLDAVDGLPSRAR